MNFQTKLNDWLMPALIGAGIYYLQSISIDIKDMSKTLAVVVEKIDQHERRLNLNETRLLHVENITHGGK